jgi:fibronectin type 3 domain-containing protein
VISIGQVTNVCFCDLRCAGSRIAGMAHGRAVAGLVLVVLSLGVPAVAAPLAAADPMIAAAGDIACDPDSSSFKAGLGSSNSCRMKYTSDLLVNSGADAVLVLGDNQYYCGGYSAFLGSYDLSWGRLKSITHPAVGNHEYLTSGGTDCNAANAGAAGYFKYFGAAAGDPTQGYYSYDVGAWHLIALNSNCSSAGGCSASSPQGKWLKADLAAHPTACTLAYWHIPLFSSGGRASSNSKSFWDQLYAAGADVILAAHDHTYERFARQTPAGTRDDTQGIREFIVGTGGANHTSFVSTAANSEVRNADTFGVLQLTLHPTSYDWRFVPEPGKTFTDSGSEPCRGPGTVQDTTPPTAPSGLTARAASSTQVDLSWTASTDNVGVTGYRILRDGAQVGTTTGSTSYSDGTASAGRTYQYSVVAVDAAGNVSAASNSASVTTPAGGGGTTVTTTLVGDATVRSDLPTTNYGSKPTLEVDGSPAKQILLKFTVSGVGTARVSSARLRLYDTDPSPAGGEFRGAPSTWDEGTVTWNTKPAAGALVATLGRVAAGTWYDVDVTPLVTGDGTFTIAVTSSNSDGADYSSKQGPSTQAPQLIVTAG